MAHSMIPFLLTLTVLGAGVTLPTGGEMPVPKFLADRPGGGALDRPGDELSVQQPRASIEFTCTEMRATVSPAYWDFYLRLYYRNTETGTLIRGVVGPFTGTALEPFDGSLVLVYVEVDVQNTIIATARVDEGCYGVGGTDVGQNSNTRANPSNTAAVASTWKSDEARRPTVA